MSRPPSRRSAPALRVLAVALSAFALAAACGEEETGFTQVDSSTARPDLCPPDLEACADEGAMRCEGNRIASCREVTAGCLGWGAAQTCPANQACREDRCAEACAGAACDLPEARRCAPGEARSVERCADGDGDGCLEWVAAEQCPASEVCNLGACAGGCTDECAEGDRRCESSGVVTCADHDADGCLEWDTPTPCEGGCALGACVESCRDVCAEVGLVRCDGPAVEVCELQSSGCLGWGPPTVCPEGTTCSLGRCGAECLHECVNGVRGCSAGGVVECGQFDRDPCADLGLPEACPSGESCSAGTCGSGCNNECTAEGARSCDAVGRSVRECRQGDEDSCLEWVVVAVCEGDDTCSNGACGGECTDECELGEARCVAGSESRVEVCGDADADPCSEWVAGDDCADNGQVCAGGSCAEGCSDECSEAECAAGAVVECGEFDGDSCLDRGTARACEPGMTCVGGACAVAPPPAGVKIAEILYQSEGQDTDVFIEIGGPAGLSVTGLTLVAVNGANGSEGGRFELKGTLDGAGRFVIAHPEAAPHIADWADVTSEFADLQNGPDNLLLEWGGQILDALGYGDFPRGAVFAGEGYPAPPADNGVSLSRIGDLQDTDNNLADFALTPVPTPGRGYEPAVRPRAEGDLVITELLADPQARPDADGEWFELYNPSDTTWELEGCTLESDPDESHAIMGSQLVAPGQRVVWARSAEPGFDPDYVYAGIVLANEDDALALTCDDEFIDLVGWDTADPGRSRSLDPASTDAQLNDDDDAWCPAPVEAAPDADAGTPGSPNPPCPADGGSYRELLLDSEWGVCDASGDWQYLRFEGAPDPMGNATLGFEWWGALCELFSDEASIEVQARDGEGWLVVGGASFNDQDDSCQWHGVELAIAESVIETARDSAGRIEVRFRIISGCPFGVGCGVLGVTLPASCGRSFELSYPY